MSGCRAHGDSVGPYVLGALEPAEMDAMRRHLDECAVCAAEERALAGLPALLDSTHADEEIATVSPQLEDAVLDRFVRERSAARRPSRRVALPALAAAAAAVVLALVLFLPSESDPAYAHADLWSMPAGGGAAGSADVSEVPAGTHMELRAEHLERGVYEVWCVRTDGRWISGGSFQARSDGSAAAELTAAVRPGDYHVLVVTRRSVAGKRGHEVMRGKLAY
jgi:hypothetical protein